MIETGRVAGFVRSVRARLKRQQLDPARAEHGARGRTLQHGEAEHIAVVVRDQIELADPDRHHADPHRRAVGEGRPTTAAALLGARCGSGGRPEGGSAGEMQQGAAGQIEVHGTRVTRVGMD